MIATGTPLMVRSVCDGKTGSSKSVVLTFCATKSMWPFRSRAMISSTR